MICLIPSQVRFSVSGSCAIAFQKLLIQSVFRVAMMSSYTARTSGLASLYSISPNVDMPIPQNEFRRKPAKLSPRSQRTRKMLHQEGDNSGGHERHGPKQ